MTLLLMSLANGTKLTLFKKYRDSIVRKVIRKKK